MVREHSLSNDDINVAIFTTGAEKEIRKLDATDSDDALTAIINCLSNPLPESVIEKPYETCQELEQLRQGDLRLYVKLVTRVDGYTILWVFAIKRHQYRNLGKFDAHACGKVDELSHLSETEIDGYIERNEALSVADLEALRDSV